MVRGPYAVGLGMRIRLASGGWAEVHRAELVRLHLGTWIASFTVAGSVVSSER